MMSPQDCYGSPPPESKEQVSARKTRMSSSKKPSVEETPQNSRSTFDAVTPSTSSRHTSARSVRGRPSSTRSRGSDASERFGDLDEESQEPRRMLDIVPTEEQPKNSKQEADNHTIASSDNDHTQYMLNLPPSLLPHWCALLICASLCLAAVAAGTPLTTNSSSNSTQGEGTESHIENLQMCMAISTLSLMLTFLAAACYIWIPASFVGTLYEVTVIGLNVILWCGALPIIMNPENALAVQGPSIVNGNLFVLSWVAFFLSWIILKLVIEQLLAMEQARRGNLTFLTPEGKNGYPPFIPITPYRMANIALIFTSLVVLISAARAFKQQLCSDWNRPLCRRIQFSMSISIMSFIGLLAAWGTFLYRSYKAHNKTSNIPPTEIMPSSTARLALVGLLAFGWFVTICLGTFGKHAPAHFIGNYYMGMWTAFVLSLYLLKKTMLEYVADQPRYAAKRASSNQHQQHKYRYKQQRIPGLVTDDDYDDTHDDEQGGLSDAPISTKSTDDMSETLTAATTPALITPKVSTHISDHDLFPSSSAKKSRDPVAMSLEESFGNETGFMFSSRKSVEDPDDGFAGFMPVVSSNTDKTEDTKSFEEDDASVQTPRRGSATRSTGGSQGRHSSGSRSVSSGEKSDFYHERVKPMSIPFGNDESQFEEDESGFDHNALSCSAITAPTDNLSPRDTGAVHSTGPDCLIDPELFEPSTSGLMA
ncbi:expressed unknown protein [Seminavis robusta]|uniref:Uncharacterized protein n=1 Tax=Seminavis robusta TaxID=568900 RepID=A0A9N8DMN2_9STRA|nr:expressed unknown protein [Seminavis robusta]|eukprot:Sro231_g093640.1 n/a (707) ;mRNA; f:54847-57067